MLCWLLSGAVRQVLGKEPMRIGGARTITQPSLDESQLFDLHRRIESLRTGAPGWGY